MNIPHPEVLLVIGLVALYLYDSTLLLARNEAVLSPGNRGWSAHFGADNFRVRGRAPLLLNPLLPHRPAFRYSWRMEGTVHHEQQWGDAVAPYELLEAIVWQMTVALFILVPLGLFSPLGELALALGIGVYYGGALAGLALTWSMREEFAIAPRKFIVLAVECLACPPFGINLVRRLSLDVRPKEDFLSAIKHLVVSDKRNTALTQVIARIEDELDWEDEDTPRSERLRAHRIFLLHEKASCPAQKF